MIWATQATGKGRSHMFHTSAIQTTLYELIEAVAEEVPPGEDHLVSRVVSQLLKNGRMRFIRQQVSPSPAAKAGLAEGRGNGSNPHHR